MKTLEFKLSLNNKQEAIIDKWLRSQQRLWNLALEMLNEFEKFSAYNKHDKQYAPCSPLPWDYNWKPINQETEWRDSAIVASLPKRDKMRTAYLPVPYSQCSIGKPGRQICRIPERYRKPRLSGDSFFAVTPYFAYKLHPEKDWLTSVPYKITQTTIKELCTSWAEYKKGKRARPRFKGRKNPMRTLSNAQSGNARLAGNDRLKMAGLPAVLVRGIENRIKTDDIRSYRIIKEPSGYYLMIVVEAPTAAIKPSDKVAGFDAGVKYLLSDDIGNHIKFPASLGNQLDNLKRLQQRASRQQKGSANQKKTYARIARVHEKIRRNRKSYAHKVTTFAVRKYGAIAVEALNLKGMVKAPAPKLSADGTHYEPNNAAAKAGLNRSLLDAGIGQLYALLEAKCTEHDRLFQKINPQYTSQTCNACGHTAKENRQSQSEFKCVACGHTDNADSNAAKNIRDKAFQFGIVPGLAGRMPALGSSECQQEGSTVSADQTATPVGSTGNPGPRAESMRGTMDDLSHPNQNDAQSLDGQSIAEVAKSQDPRPMNGSTYRQLAML